jgi:hypothetical protein
MGNRGTFELSLIDVRKQPAEDPDTTVEVKRVSDQTVIARASKLTFPPGVKFELPAFPQERNLFCEITPRRYLRLKSGVFTLTHGQVRSEELMVFREPNRWRAQFTPWAQLPASFAPLKTVLSRSEIKVRDGATIGKFTEAAYDQAADSKTTLAKASLLNLFLKMTVLIDPVTNEAPWFSYVDQIFSIGRERFIALVSEEMAGVVRQIRNNISQFPDYTRVRPRPAHVENIKQGIPAGYRAFTSHLLSVKSKAEKGVLHFTLAPGKDPRGANVFFLDADIDENGDLLKHLADIFKHTFTGGTHPFRIYDYLALAYPEADAGYQLV